MSESPKGGSADFAKKVQRQLSRSKEKVLQRLGKTVETRDEQLEHCVQQFNEQQFDGTRIYKDLRNYVNAVRDMREASRRLSQSLFDIYESDWVGEEDLGAIVEGEDLLWNDLEVKLVDQAVRTMESYVGQFPDVREKVAKRGRKLVDYDSSRHQLEALQSAKKRDDVKINKAKEELSAARSVYDAINGELKDELPRLHASRIGCYVSVFSAVSSLRDIFYKEMRTLNVDLQNVVTELQAQHPDSKFTVKGLQRFGSLRRRTLMSPRAWKSSFSEFHWSYSPRPPPRLSLRSASRDSSSLVVSMSPTREDAAPAATAPTPEVRAQEKEEQEEEEKEEEEEEEEQQECGEKTSDSSCEMNNLSDSDSLELQLSSVEKTEDGGSLPPEGTEDASRANGSLPPEGTEDASRANALKTTVQEMNAPEQDVPADKQDSRTTVV